MLIFVFFMIIKGTQMKKSWILLLLFCSLLILPSCVDDTPLAAGEIDKQALLNNEITGYQWYSEIYNTYTVNDSLINELNKLYVPGKHSFILFGKPSCSCDAPQANTFAELVKVFDAMGIDEVKYKLFSITSTKSEQPYDDILKIETIPAYFVLKDGVPIYSINDTLMYDMTHATGPNNRRLTEEYLLDALKK